MAAPAENNRLQRKLKVWAIVAVVVAVLVSVASPFIQLWLEAGPDVLVCVTPEPGSPPSCTVTR